MCTMPRVVVWAAHLAIPLAGLWLLLTRPGTDVIWQHHETHFWLVLVVAAVNVAVGAAMSVAARRREDGRLFLVSLVFLAAAGFLLAHGLATPRVLIDHPNAGFDQAMAVGLALGSVLAVLSSLRLPPKITRWQLGLRIALGLVLFAWIAGSLLELPPLSRQDQVRDVEGPMVWVAWVAIGLYILAALRFFQLYRKAPSAVLISVVTAFALLAEAMLAVTLADKWRLSWWEWHLILTAAFLFVGYSAYVQYRREGSAAGLFDGHRDGRDQPADPAAVHRRARGAGNGSAGVRGRWRAARASGRPNGGAVRADREAGRGAGPGGRGAGRRARIVRAARRAGRGGRTGPGGRGGAGSSWTPHARR